MLRLSQCLCAADDACIQSIRTTRGNTVCADCGASGEVLVISLYTLLALLSVFSPVVLSGGCCNLSLDLPYGEGYIRAGRSVAGLAGLLLCFGPFSKFLVDLGHRQSG